MPLRMQQDSLLATHHSKHYLWRLTTEERRTLHDCKKKEADSRFRLVRQLLGIFKAEKQKQRCHKEVLRRGTSVWLCNRRKTCWSLLPKILSVFLWHWYLRFPSGKPPFSKFHVIFEIKWISYTGHKNAMCGPDYLCHLILSLSPYSILLAITWFWDGPCPKAGPPEPRRLRTSVWVLRKADFPNCWTDMRCRKCGASLMFCAELRTKPVLKKQNQERDPYNIIWALNQVILRED